MTSPIEIIIEDHEDWNFARTDTKYMTHGIHPYPAKMIPQISRRLIQRYGNDRGLVLDPFTGSGGVLVEARLANMNSIGIDVNPLACLLSEVKSNPINPKNLTETWDKIGKKIKTGIDNEDEYSLPLALETGKLEYWFKENTIQDLLIIRNEIQKIENEKIRKFFSICLSSSVRKVSGTRGGEFKLYRIKPEKWETYNPDTFSEFSKLTNEYIGKMGHYFNEAPREPFSYAYQADNRTIFSEDFPEEGNEIFKTTPPNLIVTSPPYGDSQTTVAYGQFSRYPALWINYEDGFEKTTIMKVDKLGLGGTKNRNIIHDFPTFSKTLDEIAERDVERSFDANSFFNDLYQSLEVMYNVLDEKGIACIVVANRTMKRVRIPTQLIIAEMALDIGFGHKVTLIPREIPSKRLPWKNAPENIQGLEGNMMSNENIIILMKS